MRKQKRGRKLHRERGGRRALLKSLAYNLLWRNRIQTSQAKAKELRPFVERLITKAKKRDLSSIRYLKRYFNNETVNHVVTNVGPKYNERPGGYTRITKLPIQRGNRGERAIIELV